MPFDCIPCLLTSKSQLHNGQKRRGNHSRRHNEQRMALLKASVQGQKCYLGKEINSIDLQLEGAEEKPSHCIYKELNSH